jgi:hypothetical protein
MRATPAIESNRKRSLRTLEATNFFLADGKQESARSLRLTRRELVGIRDALEWSDAESGKRELAGLSTRITRINSQNGDSGNSSSGREIDEPVFIN